MIEEYKDVQNQFDKVIEFSQNFIPHTDELFDLWYENKKYFIEKFGNKLIWESPEPVSFPLLSEDKERKLDNFINSVVLYRYDNYALARFLQEERDGFFDNITINEYRTDDGVIIPKGMKLLKSFKFFEKNERTLDDLQTTASRLIQENKVEGKFCISVHPLDFISCSENQYRWRSCHALDGEYRSGNLSYMCDKTTVICYIKGDEDVKLPNFPPYVPWNNKKWRMWLYLSDEHNALMAGRPYPFTISGVLEYARRMFFEQLGFAEWRWSKWHHDMLSNYEFKDGTNEYVPMRDILIMNGKFVSRWDIVKDQSNLHYDDLLKSSYYTPWYCWRTTTKEDIMFSVGSEVPCLHCDEDNNIYSPEAMLCEHCWNEIGSDYEYCCHCDTRHHRDDMYYVQGDWVCTRCFDEYCCTCATCGDNLWTEDAYWDDDTEEWYCWRHRPDRD